MKTSLFSLLLKRFTSGQTQKWKRFSAKMTKPEENKEIDISAHGRNQCHAGSPETIGWSAPTSRYPSTFDLGRANDSLHALIQPSDGKPLLSGTQDDSNRAVILMQSRNGDETLQNNEETSQTEPKGGRLLPLTRFLVVYGCLALSVLLASLDQTIGTYAGLYFH